MNKDTIRGSAVVEVLRSDSAIDVGKEYLEIAIDAAIESSLFEKIPLIRTAVGLFNTVGSVRDQLLANKLIRFLFHLSMVSQVERNEMVDKLNENDKFAGKIGSAIIEILDRMESQEKPELAAKCFAAYARQAISFEELRRLLLALERIPSFDIGKLDNFSKATISDSIQMDESLLLTFVNAGLGKNNGGFDGGAILPTNLCKRFVEICIC